MRLIHTGCSMTVNAAFQTHAAADPFGSRR